MEILIFGSKLPHYRPKKFLKGMEHLFNEQRSFNELLSLALLDKKGELRITQEEFCFFRTVLKESKISFTLKLEENERLRVHFTNVA